MDESEENMSTEDVRSLDSPLSVKSKPKKRSLVERELETNMTARVTSPVTGEGTSTSRYGRARRLKTGNDLDPGKVMKPLRIDTKTQPQAYKMHASNSPIRKESPKRAVSVASSIENQIENIYNENMSLSRFGSNDEAKSQSPAKKFTKVYIRKDLIQKPDTDTVVLIKNMFSPGNKSSHLNNILERSSEKYSLNGHAQRNGFLDTSSVVKTLDFDGKKKKDIKETKEKTVAKNELFELEAGCDYQVGDLAWARVGTYPFWPCIVTREPFTDMFVKKKLFGRVEHDVIHVTFFGDNGRRGWIVDNMLRRFHGRTEFEGARAKFTPEAKKKDPRFYAAHFVSDKKLSLWNVSVDEAEILMREPKRLRIDILYDMLEKARATKTTPKREKSGKITRTDSDVSLSESLYDTLFSEDDAKTDDSKRTKKSRNKSLDVSEVVTACLDNMAAKTGIIKIQKQSHMDRWLQKAKSKTPEKSQPKLLVKTRKEKRKDKAKKKQKEITKPRRNESVSSEKNLLPYQNEHDYSSVNYENHDINDSSNINTDFEESEYDDKVDSDNIEVIATVESIPNNVEYCNQDDIITTIVSDDIVMNDVENVNKVENAEFVHNVSELPKDNLPNSNVIKVECSISSKETEQVESKVELLLQNDVLSNVGLQRRRSKRNGQSDVEKNDLGSKINIDKKELDDILDLNNIEVAVEVESLSNNVEDCSKDDITLAVNIDDIVMNDADNVNKVECSEVVHNVPETPKENSPGSNVTNVENSISPKETEQVKSKVELPLQNDVSSNIGLQPRRSKRKRQSDVEKNKSVLEENNDRSKINTVLNVDVQKESVDVQNETGLDDKVDHNNIEVTATVESLSNNVEDCSQGDMTKTVVIDDIVMNHVDNINKIEKCDSVNKISETTNQSVPDSNAPDVENSASSKETEQIELKVDSLKSDVLSNIELQPRRSKRKRLSDAEKNKSIVEKNNRNVQKEKSIIEKNLTDGLKLESNDAIVKTDIETTFSDRNIVDSNTNHRENVLDRDKKDETEPIKVKDTKEGKPVVSEEGKETSKQSKEHNNSHLLLSKARRPVVVIEQLKLDGFESLIISKAAKQKEEPKLCKLKEANVTKNETSIENPRLDDIEVTEGSSVLKNVDSGVSKMIAGTFLCTNESDCKNISVQDANIDTEDISNVKNQDEMLAVPNKKNLGDKIHYDALNATEPEKMDVCDTDFHHTNEKDQTENVDSRRISKDSDPSLPPSNLDIKTVSSSLSSNEGKGKINDKLNVVIGEETYVFDRTLSQDYDEIDPDKEEEADKTDPTNEEIIKNDGNCELNNVSTHENPVSPIYDQYDMEENKIEIEKSVGKSESNFLKDDENEAALEIGAESIVNGVEGKGQVFCKASVHKSKEKIEKEPKENSPSQLVASKSIPMLNGGEINVSDEKLEKTNKKSKQIILEPSNVDITKEHKDKKISPKLSLNRSKNHSSNEQANEVKICKIETPKSIFINNHSKQDKVVSNHVKDTNDAKTDTVTGLDFEMLIDMERTKAQTLKINGFVEGKQSSPEKKLKEEDIDSASMKSEDSGASITRRKIRSKEKLGMNDPDFMKYLELRHDALIDEQPELSALSSDEIVTYLYQTWLYEESNKSDRKKTDDAEQSNLVKGLNQDPPPPKKYKKKPKVEKVTNGDIRDLMPKDKPKRKATQSKPYYNEEYSDLEEEDLETFSIFDKDTIAQNEDGEEIDEVELYFEKLTKPKPNVFKGYVREKVCEICEKTGNLVKCKSCHGTFHPDCVKKEEQIAEAPAPTRGKRKRKKARGRKPKGYDESLLDSESQSDEKSQDANLSEELNMSIDDEESHITIDATNFEAQLEIKMKEIQVEQIDDYESDQEISWDAPPGQCEIVDLKHKAKQIDYSNFKCYNCVKYDTPICFVCRSDKSPKNLTEARQKCQVAHCHKYYHMECLEYWPQTQFNSWEPSKTNKKVIEYIEALSCPRHVCHTCVSDDPRGCKTRFCGDKLARCVKCPATYHSFTRCLPAGTQILTGSQIICPRHYEHKAGTVPRHVNTGWCFICALGGTLICCEYCPTSFHAECLNIKPPEGSYMCEDCETGRLPLYGEMVWVKLGHYRWWPGIVLHPTEIPENIMAVKHSPGEFVVRFFGQYDHYWVNRGRVFPFQEGDSGKISSQKSKIDAAFTTAMEHAQRACEILKNVEPNEEEDMDIASSLLPPHYVKLKVNKPVGSLTNRRDIDANSLTQCDCDPTQPDPCGPYSHCLNRMLLTECGPLCRAGERCNNRAFERRHYPRLAAYRTPQRGWGLKTLEAIRQGQFVIEYVGELIDEEEFRRRMARKHEIRDENFYFLTLDKERMIDAGPKGNLARFMNHCCEPNCETQKWTVLGDVRVGLFALRDIPANSEVTFNYNLECAGIEKKRCLCGAKRCSGYIGAKPKQEEAQPKKLKGPGKRTYKKRKHVEDSPSTSKSKPPIKIKIKPIKPRELTEIEKDLLIIKNATNGMSSDSDSRLSSIDDKKDLKALKRKRVSFSSDEVSVKKVKREVVKSEVD